MATESKIAKRKKTLDARTQRQLEILGTLQTICGNLGRLQRTAEDRATYREVQEILGNKIRRLSHSMAHDTIMTPAEIDGLLNFVRGALRGRKSRVLNAAQLQAAGYDVLLLQELVANYNRLPLAQRDFSIRVEKDGSVSVNVRQ